MRKCFPALITKIDQFRFKHPRSDGSSGSIDDESAPDDDSDTLYQGKRKNNLVCLTTEINAFCFSVKVMRACNKAHSDSL